LQRKFFIHIFADSKRKLFSKYSIMEPVETRRERFEKVASNRVQRILDTLSLLKNCAKKNNYEYDEGDVDMMFSEINKAVRDAKAAFFAELEKSNKHGFKFSSQK